MGSVDIAINQAQEFILLKRDDAGLWRDFYTSHHQESVDWISAYIGVYLLESGVEQSQLKETANSLSMNQSEYGGWGYNKRVVPDADSTAYAIMFLSEFDFDLETAKSFLLKHQNQDGSFSTYLPKLIRKYRRLTHLISVKGWCSGIPEVTATVLQARGKNDKAVEYLKNSQQEDGSWRTYWGTDDIYATAQAVLTLDSNLNSEKGRAQEWLSKQNTSNPFYVALIIQSLASSEHNIENRLDELIYSQNPDGSWSSQPFLRFPYPSDIEPWKTDKRWRQDISDQNRLFTTATCLSSLVRYRNEKLHYN